MRGSKSYYLYNLEFVDLFDNPVIEQVYCPQEYNGSLLKYRKVSYFYTLCKEDVYEKNSFNGSFAYRRSSADLFCSTGWNLLNGLVPKSANSCVLKKITRRRL